jgi:hypothetical protein
MYDMEEGQIRSAEELKQTMNLFSYGIGLFDFTAPTELSYFAQIRAMIKVAINIGVDKQKVMDVIKEKYLNQILGNNDVKLKSEVISLNLYWDELVIRLKEVASQKVCK